MADTSIDLTAAAKAYLEEVSSDYALSVLSAAAVWEALTGLDAEAAEAYAEEVASANPPITAHVAPF